MNLKNIRKQYQLASLNENDILTDPFEQFGLWLQQAINSELPDATAMNLSTVDENHYPHSRIVLLKEVANEAFVFFTNYEGRKAKDIEANNHVALLFFWPDLERQVRIEGVVSKISEELSEAYFSARPIDSRIGAWASPQSRPIRSAGFLEEQFRHYAEKFGEDVPKPPHWGGYEVHPVTFEFWQGRPNRLHDRLLFTLEDGKWRISRLAP